VIMGHRPLCVARLRRRWHRAFRASLEIQQTMRVVERRPSTCPPVHLERAEMRLSHRNIRRIPPAIEHRKARQGGPIGNGSEYRLGSDRPALLIAKRRPDRS